MRERQRSSTTVDIQCAQCGKPMMMLNFNYTSLERGFESISLRCQYCKAEETRPWPREPNATINPEQGADIGGNQTAVVDGATYADDTPQPDQDATLLPDKPSLSVEPDESPEK